MLNNPKKRMIFISSLLLMIVVMIGCDKGVVDRPAVTPKSGEAADKPTQISSGIDEKIMNQPTLTPWVIRDEDTSIEVTVAGNSWPSNYSIKPFWVEPKEEGDEVLLKLSDVLEKRNVNFTLKGTQDGDLIFMAYMLELKTTIYIRSGATPWSRAGFTLDGNILFENNTYSVFNALTGKGLRGAGVIYPKAPVSYHFRDDKIVIRYVDLLIANRLTLMPTGYTPRVKNGRELY